jgi:hypothetical protein
MRDQDSGQQHKSHAAAGAGSRTVRGAHSKAAAICSEGRAVTPCGRRQVPELGGARSRRRRRRRGARAARGGAVAAAGGGGRPDGDAWPGARAARPRRGRGRAGRARRVADLTFSAAAGLYTRKVPSGALACGIRAGSAYSARLPVTIGPARMLGVCPRVCGLIAEFAVLRHASQVNDDALHGLHLHEKFARCTRIPHTVCKLQRAVWRPQDVRIY